jgi:fructose-1,6-bisphosphatase II
VDPLECTDLCARGLPGALSTLALAPRGALWSPGPAFYMDKLVLPAAARDAAQITDPPETTVENVAEALGKHVSEMRIVVLDKPRYQDLARRLRAAGATVMTPPAGDLAGALSVLLPDGGADLLLGIGGTPEGVLAACAVRALGSGMQGRLAPQREEERRALDAAGLSPERVLELEDLVGGDAAFFATGVTGGLLAAPREERGWLTTESLVIAAGAIHHIRHTTPTEE